MLTANIRSVLNDRADTGKKEHSRYVLFFFAAVLAFIIGQIVSELFSPARAQLLQAASIVPIIWFGKKLVVIRTERDYFRTMFILLMLNNVFIILRASHINYQQIKDFIFIDFRFWPYLVPFAAFFVTRSFPFAKLFEFIYWLGLAFMGVSVVCWHIFKATPGIAELCIWAFSSASGFVLLTAFYHSTKRILVATAAVVLGLYISTVLARRNIMLTNINFIVFSYLTYLFFSKGQATKKFLSIYGIVLVLIAAIFVFLQQKNSGFKLVANRMQDDSREYVFRLFFIDMQDHMLVGKGIDGTYYCPLISEDPNYVDSVEFRDLIECGYLQVILKGGYLNLVLLMAIMVPAAFKGIFRSNNLFSKGCGLLVFLWLIDMGPYGLPNLSLRYILVWICIGVCYNKKILQSSEDEIKRLLAAPETAIN